MNRARYNFATEWDTTTHMRPAMLAAEQALMEANARRAALWTRVDAAVWRFLALHGKDFIVVTDWHRVQCTDPDNFTNHDVVYTGGPYPLIVARVSEGAPSFFTHDERTFWALDLWTFDGLP